MRNIEPQTTLLSRSYTFHEHLDEFDLINMPVCRNKNKDDIAEWSVFMLIAKCWCHYPIATMV